MGLGVEVEIGVSGLAIHFVSQRAIRSPVNVWVMMGLGVDVETGVSGLAVHFVSQRAIRSPVNIYVQEGGGGVAVSTTLTVAVGRTPVSSSGPSA
jgi:hypothetical protein